MHNSCYTGLLACAILCGGSVLKAETGWGWPGLFSNSEPSTSRNPASSWWAGKQPGFGSPSSRATSAPVAPSSRWVWKPTPPAPIKKLNQGTKKVYHYTIGWMMPHKTSAPTSITGSNTNWASKPKPASSSSGWGSWFKSSEPQQPGTVRDFLLMERNDP